MLSWQSKGVGEEGAVAGAADSVFEAAVDLVLEVFGGRGLHLLDQVGDFGVVVGFFEVFGGDGGEGGVGVDVHADDVVGVGRDGVSADVADDALWHDGDVIARRGTWSLK